MIYNAQIALFEVCSMRRSLIVFLLSTGLLAACDNQRIHELYAGPQDQVSSVEANDTVLVTHVDAVEQDAAFIGQKHTYHLSPGKHVMVVEYGAMFQLDADRHEKLVSPPIKVTFTAIPGKTYAFKHAEQKTVEEARVFAKSPHIELVQLPENTPVNAEFEQSLPTRFLPAIRFENTDSYGFASDRAALTPTTAPVAAVTTAAVAVPSNATAPVATNAVPTSKDVISTATASTADSPLESLKNAWQKASPDQRKAFQEWLKNQ